MQKLQQELERTLVCCCFGGCLCLLSSSSFPMRNAFQSIPKRKPPVPKRNQRTWTLLLLLFLTLRWRGRKLRYSLWHHLLLRSFFLCLLLSRKSFFPSSSSADTYAAAAHSWWSGMGISWCQERSLPPFFSSLFFFLVGGVSLFLIHMSTYFLDWRTGHRWVKKPPFSFPSSNKQTASQPFSYTLPKLIISVGWFLLHKWLAASSAYSVMHQERGRKEREARKK